MWLLCCRWGMLTVHICSLFKFISGSRPVQPQPSASDHWTVPAGRSGLKTLVYHINYCGGRWQWLPSNPHRFSQALWGFKSHSKQTCDPPVTRLFSIQRPACVQLQFWACGCLCQLAVAAYIHCTNALQQWGLMDWYLQYGGQVVSTLDWRRKSPCRDICLWAQKTRTWNPRTLSNPPNWVPLRY